MSKARVFIASSTEQINFAEMVAEELDRKKLEPRCWWNTFKAGDFVLPRLLELCREVDAAIIIARGDDMTWYRGDWATSPRDNVLLEFGLFCSRLGPKHTLIVRDQNAKIPSDLAGLTMEQVDDPRTCAQRVASQVLHALNAMPEVADRMPLKIVCDPELAVIWHPSKIPSDWLMRSMYVGLEGASAWLEIAEDPNYQSNQDREQLRDAISRAVKADQSVGAYISLGPGDGALDVDIVTEFQRHSAGLRYIPVDISDGLLCHAVSKVSLRSPTPVGILADFEERMGFIIQQASQYARRPFIFGLLGNTFGNLDRNERTFINEISKYMQAEDRLLIEVALRRNGPRDTNPVFDANTLSQGSKRFFASGAARHLKFKGEDVAANFEKYVSVTITEAKHPVPGTDVLSFYACNGPSKNRFATVRRYHLDQLQAWFRQRNDFDVQTELLAAVDPHVPYDSCLFMLTKRGRR